MTTTVSIADDLRLTLRAIPGNKQDNDAYIIAVSWDATSEEMGSALVDEALDDVVDSQENVKHDVEYRVYFFKEDTENPHVFAADVAEAIVERTEQLYDEYRAEYDSPIFDEELGNRGF